MCKLTYSVAAILFACLSASSAYACCEAEEKAIMAKCTADLTEKKTKEGAEKACRCGYDLMRNKLKDDSIVLFAAMMNGEAGVKAIIAEKGMEWFQANIQEISKVAPEIDKTCETK